LPGYSLHEDLRTLQEAGLTPFQALSAATRTPGEFISKYVPNSVRFGIVSIGTRADLILVSANPLKSFEVLKNPLGVMFGGHWKVAEDLHATLEANKIRTESELRELLQ